jgi:hypothetical protein
MSPVSGGAADTIDSEGRASALAVGLRYSTDARPGIARRRAGRGLS